MDNTSLWALFINAGLLVKMVMLALLLASIISWATIAKLSLLLRREAKAFTQFEQIFWSGTELYGLYQQLTGKSLERHGAQQLFLSGFQEYIRLGELDTVASETVVSGVERAVSIELAKENSRLENQLPVLATIQSISPYVGLFGTVWGIMHSFRALASVKQASIAMVAPGLAEALVATAVGLIAAIPAGIAYNKFSTKAGDLVSKYEIFAAELTGILFKRLHAERSNASTTLNKGEVDAST